MVVTPPIPTGEWDKSDLLASSGRCSASTSPTTRCSASSTCWPRPPTCRSPALAEEGTVGDGQVVDARRHPLRGQRRITKQGQAWASASLEDLERRGRGAVLPEHLRAGRAVHRRGRDRGGQGPGRPARRPAPADGDGPVDPGHHRGRRRSSRSCSRCRRRAARRRWSSGSRRCWPAIPARPRCTSSWSTAARATLLRLGPLRVAPTTALMADLKALLGPSAVAG